ncbi:head-tail adaptor protein [Alcaligenes sp. EGD-AK7]|uniref:phage head closure protein n=1 Tax=Alcaligenes sp. EGD-AK7 TaxID=1386079 RepID=UPI0002AA9ABD|nr:MULTISPECIES: phage head closure protein [unclassified Alcaligenes]EKU30769.1 phage head-tail adaptor [Alcaligenes sp. HPC1271]ERI33444.1 head-tail adaptor protein [Alcaligenes sp. EGD-AK7]
MRAGPLRHKLRIEEKRVISIDPYSGQAVYDWAEVATVWARIEPLSARDFIAASTTQSAITTRITIRYRAGITRVMRLVHQGKFYSIVGILPDSQSGLEYLTLPCVEGVNQG